MDELFSFHNQLDTYVIYIKNKITKNLIKYMIMEFYLMENFTKKFCFSKKKKKKKRQA